MEKNHDLEPLAAWTLERVAQLLKTRIEPRWAGHPFGPVSTDSRSVAPGQFFLALRGEKFDGHRFCEAAARNGAAGLILEDSFAPADALDHDLPILRVADTLRAYGDLAAARRRLWDGPLLAISGSAGKTTTRRLVAEALRRHVRVLEPVKNYNNLIGVPTTLLGLEAAHEIAVLELGMNLTGELRRLAEIAAPTAALLTQISMTHVGMFASISELTQAKLDLFRGCAEGVPLVVNAGCPRTMMAMERFADRHRIIYFLGEGAPVWDDVEISIRVKNVSPLRPPGPFGYRFDLVVPGKEIKGLELWLFGRHHLENVAAAAALLHAAGRPPEWAAAALEGFRTEPLRGEVIKAGGRTLVLDCYNASPGSMIGSLSSLVELPCPGRRLLVLADMLELGSYGNAAHEMLLEPLRKLAPALFFGLGPQCAELARILAAEGWEARGFEDRNELAQALKEQLRPGDLVFFKGSRGFSLEKVAQAIAPEIAIEPEQGKTH